MTNSQAVTQWLTDALTKCITALWSSITATFATKDEVAAIETADVTDVSQSTAAAIWSNYTFATTDNDQAQSGEQSGESGNE